MIRSACVWFFLAFAACSDGRVLHPTAENLPPRDAALITRDSLPDGLAPGALDQWRRVRNDFISAQTTLRLGSDEEGPRMFGYISHADIGPDGNLVVLAGQAQEIRIFDPGGRFVESFGGLGDGPLEL